MLDKFNIRVYGIWIHDNKILLSHENIDGFKMVKFPGGGLELGESTIECVRREFLEELNVNVEVGSHIHVTNTVIQSAFRANEQIVAVHYAVHGDPSRARSSAIQPTSVGRQNVLAFKWHELNEEIIALLSFEMDKQAVHQLMGSPPG